MTALGRLSPKILEAMALHTPVIATSKGAEGLAAKDGVHLLIADTAQAFAEATIRLLSDPQLRRQLADQSYELVRTKYDWTVILPEFLNLAERVAFDAIPAVHDPIKADAR
jgi:glycosyltransferase involved in cell wall biosynthesis